MIKRTIHEKHTTEAPTIVGESTFEYGFMFMQILHASKNLIDAKESARIKASLVFDLFFDIKRVDY